MIDFSGNVFTTWDDAEKELFSPEEIAENRARVERLKDKMRDDGDKALPDRPTRESTKR